MLRAWLRLAQALLVLGFFVGSIRHAVLDAAEIGINRSYVPALGGYGFFTIELWRVAVSVNVWLLIAAGGVMLIERKLLGWIVPIRPDACPACGHDSSALARCPECGLILTPPSPGSPDPEPPARGA